MGILSELEKIKPGTFASYFLLFLLVLSPGVLLVFIFARELFLTLDSYKLSVLSISLLTPFIGLNYILFTLSKIDQKHCEDCHSYHMLYPSIVVSSIILFVVAIIGFVEPLTLQSAVTIAGSLQALFLGSMIVVIRRNRNR